MNNALIVNVRAGSLAATKHSSSGTAAFGLRFQPVNATLCRNAIVSQKCFRIRGIAKYSKGRRALVDGDTGYRAQLTARSPG